MKAIHLLKNAKAKFQDPKAAVWVSIAIWIFSILLCLPSLATWLGLPPEGDAMDYRVPIIQWMVRHHTFPNWQWTMVDDYPALGELLMVPLYLLKPALMRLIPVFAYFGCAWIAGKFFSILTSHQNTRHPKSYIWLCSAWLLGLRPLAIQSNLLMVDNLASFFLLASLFFTIEERKYLAGLFLAMALATRYTTWPLSLTIFLISLLFGKSSIKIRAKNTLIIASIAALGALPFLIRNTILNHNPFFPFATSVFNGFVSNTPYFFYGRGKDLISLLLLPYDLLITNSFINSFYDYTLGKLFYVHLGGAIVAVFSLWKKSHQKDLLKLSSKGKATLFASMCFLIIWFFGSQQMRFLVPFLILVEVYLFILCARYFQLGTLSVLTLLSCLSVMSIQKDSIALALHNVAFPFSKKIESAKTCIATLGIKSEEAIGFADRDSLLGFLDRDFVYMDHHPYIEVIPGYTPPRPRYAFSNHPLEGYVPWPEKNPCIYKLK